MLCGFGVFATGLRALDCGLWTAGADEPMNGEPMELHDERGHVPRLPYGVPVCVWTVPEISPASAG